MPKLGVNIDHVATLREARKILSPDPIAAAKACMKAGCDSIVCHQREDRRHIKDKDVAALRKISGMRLNLEMYIAKDIVDFACLVKPDQATLVPERRQEITTEGGLDATANLRRIRPVVGALMRRGIDVSLFINPDMGQVESSARTGARIIEFHTGVYANARSREGRRKELEVIKKAALFALELGLEVNAGHGLDYENVKAVAAIKGINELNIGHSIISRAVFVGIGRAVGEMLEAIR